MAFQENGEEVRVRDVPDLPAVRCDIGHVGDNGSDPVLISLNGIIMVKPGTDLLFVRVQVHKLRSIHLPNDFHWRKVPFGTSKGCTPKQVLVYEEVDRAIKYRDIRKNSVQDTNSRFCSGFWFEIFHGVATSRMQVLRNVR